MTLPKFEIKCYKAYKIQLKAQKQRRDEKKAWSEEIMVSCDINCGADQKMVWCAFPRALDGL